MFLRSEAVRVFEDRQFLRWDWTTTTILLVSYDWEPTRGGAEALAGRRLVRALIDAGARVHVLAASAPADDELRARSGLTVVPAGPPAVGRIGRAIQMVRTTVPESAGGWVVGAVDAGLRTLETLPADTIIYGRAMPGTSNVVAWHLARRTGRPWLAHFSDAWPSWQVLSGSRKIIAPYKWPLFSLWRRRILRDAGALTFTNPAQAAEIVGRRSPHLHKSFVVTHLASRPAPRRTSPQYDVFHLVHTGNLYPPGHSAATLMQGLRLFLDRTPAARNHVRFTQAGWSNGDLPAWAHHCRLEDVVHVVGRLDEDSVLTLTQSASLLVAIDYSRAHSTTLLSKLPDYVNARRPILAITAADSALARFCRDDGAGLTASYDAPGEIAERIGKAFAAWRHRRLEPLLPRPLAIAAFASQTVLSELAAAVVVARRAHRVETRPARATLRAGADLA